MDFENSQSPPSQAEIGQRIGPHVKTFSQSGQEILAGRLLCFIFTAAGTGLLYLALHHFRQIIGGLKPNESLTELVFLTGAVLVLGLGFYCFTYFLWVWLNRNMINGILVCQNGMCWRLGESFGMMRWDEIQHVHEKVIREHLPILNPPFTALMPTLTNYTYSIWWRGSENELFVGANAIRGVKSFGDILRQECSTRGASWTSELDKESGLF